MDKTVVLGEPVNLSSAALVESNRASGYSLETFISYLLETSFTLRTSSAQIDFVRTETNSSVKGI